MIFQQKETSVVVAEVGLQRRPYDSGLEVVGKILRQLRPVVEGRGNPQIQADLIKIRSVLSQEILEMAFVDDVDFGDAVEVEDDVVEVQ